MINSTNYLDMIIANRKVLYIVACMLIAVIIIMHDYNYCDQHTLLAKESCLRRSLYEIRSAILLYREDTGKYPKTLHDLTGPDQILPKGHHLHQYQGPYLSICGGINDTGIPVNPFVEDNNDVNAHWSYDKVHGNVYSAYSGISSKGNLYSKW